MKKHALLFITVAIFGITHLRACDLNLISCQSPGNAFGWAADYEDLDYDIVGHGLTDDTSTDMIGDGYASTWSAADLSGMIDYGLASSTPTMELIACSLGRTQTSGPASGYCFAQDLANNAGLSVMAADSNIYYGYNLFVGEYTYVPFGSWINFSPQ